MSVNLAGFDRVLPLESAFNLRDLGGYETRDGGRIKSGLLYRSGTMSMLSDADERHLAALGIATVCDLRRPRERESQPTRWCKPAGVHYWSRDYTEVSGVLGEMVKDPATTPAVMRDTMIAVYRAIPTDHGPSYRVMFERLLGGHVPLLFNCAAGKDRTGVGAALILHALNVPHETIVEDYLLTNSLADFSRFRSGNPAILLRSQEVLAPMFAADADYLAAMFETLDRQFGGVDRYLADAIGVDLSARARLRALLVE